MKILIITNNVKNMDVVKAGLEIAKQHAETVGINFEYDFKESTRQFTGMTFNNAAVGSGACVNPNEILAEVTTPGYKIACLIYDWDKVSPKPTNPVQSPILKLGCNPIQVPEQWCGVPLIPEVLSDFFLHEICHSGYFFANNVAGDQTHAYIQEFSQKQRWEYYVYLLAQLKLFLEVPASDPVYITPTLRKGSKGQEVKDLQLILKDKGFYTYGFITGYFGSITESAVKGFQKSKGLFIDGVVGPRTWDALKKNSNITSKLDLWAQAIQKFEGYYPGSRSYKNNNPGNIRFVGQTNTIGQDDKGFCIFASYEVGFGALKALLTYAASGKSKLYNKEGGLNAFFSVYAPASDNNEPLIYAKYVAKYIGIPLSTPIKELL